MINLYWWSVRPNIGDYYGHWLLTKLGFDHEYCKDNPDLAICGSILEHKSITASTKVWGCGFHMGNFYPGITAAKPENIYAVRGKLTKDKLGITKDIALGDPGILLSKFYKPVSRKKYKFGIVCHFLDYDYFNEKYGKIYHIISTSSENVEDFADKLNECEFIFSTSLHGIIFSHSLGIPAVHLEHINVGSTDNFKFKDYYSTINVNYIKVDESVFKNVNIFLANTNKYLPTNIAELQTKLLDAFPYKKPKICLCAIAKNENNYIKEWVDYHKKLGFTNIVLYDNNDTDGEVFTDVIQDYIKSGFVKIKNVRGLSNQQIKRYNEFYHSQEAAEYDWIAFFDIDEFLHLDKDKTVQQWLISSKYDNFDAIAVNWKYFDDNNQVAVINNNYSITRFTREFKEQDWEWAQHRFSKRFVRTGLNIVINSSHGPIATAQMNEYKTETENMLKVCNIAGQKLGRNNLAFKEWTYDGGYLAHYRYKTIEEYATCKKKRGYATLYKNSGKDMSYEEFFKLNELTAEKLAWMHKHNINYSASTVKIKENNAQLHQAPDKKQNNTKKKKNVADGQSGTFLYF